MDLKTILGEAWKENMTLADVDAALAERDLIDRSEAETLANNRVAATKRLLDAANKKLEAANKKSTDTGTELADALARIASLESASAESERKATIAATTATLIAQGYDEALAAETATAMADNNMAKILENQGKYLASKTQAIKDELLNGTKPPASGNGTPTVNKDDFAKMTLNDKVKFATENPEQYKEFYGGN